MKTECPFGNESSQVLLAYYIYLLFILPFVTLCPSTDLTAKQSTISEQVCFPEFCE